MATLSQLYAELRIREKRLLEAESRGWRDCVPGERASVAEFRHELVEKLLDPDNSERLIAAIGDVDMGAVSP